MNTGYIAVVGGVNVDISGTSTSLVLHGDSNPGHVTITPGGVGRNIAECMARLGLPIEMITLLGDDANAELIRSSCKQSGIRLQYSDVLPGGRTGTYLCLNEPDGDLYCAISDMAICDAITPEYLAGRLDVLNHAALVLVDANLPQETLIWLAENCTAPLAADPVSVKKAVKLSPILHRLVLIKPNRHEAAVLTGIQTDSLEGVHQSAKALHEAGVKNAFISLGGSGVCYASDEGIGHCPCFKSDILNTNGCGDAFMAGAVAAWLNGSGASDMAKTGQAASSINAEAATAVNPALTMESVARRMTRGE